MTGMKKINVLIDGRNFTVVGAEDERYVRELAQFVDLNIKKFANKNERLSPTMAATLAAFNIADELHKLQEKHKDLEKKSKEPLERFEDLKKEVQDANNRVKELEKNNLEQKDEVIKTKMSKEELIRDMNSVKEEFEDTKHKIHRLEEINKELKDKHFNSQLEIVELKKQLTQTLNLIEGK